MEQDFSSGNKRVDARPQDCIQTLFPQNVGHLQVRPQHFAQALRRPSKACD